MRFFYDFFKNFSESLIFYSELEIPNSVLWAVKVFSCSQGLRMLLPILTKLVSFSDMTFFGIFSKLFQKT